MGRRRRTRTSSVELFGAEFNELSRKKSGGHFVPLAEMPRWPTPMAGNDVTESAQTPTSASTNSSVDPLCEWIVKAEKNVEKSMKASDCQSLSEYNKNKEERERERGTCGMASSFQLPGRPSSAHVHLYKRPKSFLGWIDGCSKSFFKIISSELVEIQS